jgi:DNA-binding GntR family transcriptional regulator
LGTSRTPLREAIRRLQTEGLVDIEPHRGALVADLSVEELIELYHIRAVLDGLATRLAVEHLSDGQIGELEEIVNRAEGAVDPSQPDAFEEFNRRFHEIIYQGAQAPLLYEMITNLYTKTSRHRHLSLRTPGRISEVFSEHRHIVDALKARDAQAAEHYARQHHENTAQALVKFLDKKLELESAPEQQGVPTPDEVSSSP